VSNKQIRGFNILSFEGNEAIGDIGARSIA